MPGNRSRNACWRSTWVELTQIVAAITIAHNVLIENALDAAPTR